jgi:3'-phosphoadenosine 5'-phosphosulfate sulfotransferase (PAPS reductase)/FAD synthetase
MAAERPPDALYGIADRLRTLADAVILGLSCGKDSLALLSVCAARFTRVEAFYLYTTPGLSFHERVLASVERRWPNVKVTRLPHWCLGRLLEASVFRPPTKTTASRLTVRDIENTMRLRTGLEWVVTGQKRHDSLERVAMLNKCRGLDLKTKRAFPLAWWSDALVYNHLKRERVPLSAEYAVLGHSYGGSLEGCQLAKIKARFPDDYARIIERFPYAAGEVFRYERFGDGERTVTTRGANGKRPAGDRPEGIAEGQPLPEVPDGDGASLAAEPGPL